MKNEKGMTLIEVLISMVIMMIGVMAVISMQGTSAKGNRVARDVSQSVSVAHKKKEDIVSSNYSFYKDVDSDSVSGLEDRGVSDSDYSSKTVIDNLKYDVYINVAENYPEEGTKTYRIIVDWNSYGEIRNTEMSFIKSEAGISGGLGIGLNNN